MKLTAKLAIATAAITTTAAILLTPTAAAEARDPYPNSAGTRCTDPVVKAHYSSRYYRVAAALGERTPGRNIRRYGLTGKRRSKCRHLRRSSRTFKRWLAPPPAPVLPGDTSSASAAPPYAGGAYSIPSYIVQCESGGDYGASNPSGAFGAYQIMPGTAAAYECDLSTPAGQDQCAARIYAAEGASPWACG